MTSHRTNVGPGNSLCYDMSMDTYLDTRCHTHPIFPGQWRTQVRLYGDTWTTVEEGDLFTCVRTMNYLNGTTPRRN